MALSPFAHVAIQGVVQPDEKGLLGLHWDSAQHVMKGRKEREKGEGEEQLLQFIKMENSLGFFFAKAQ